jgi:hypothetical protein
MNRGIFKHGSFKSFLTRGIFGKFFRSILYTDLDYFSYYFVDDIQKTLISIEKKYKSDRANFLNTWLFIASLKHFEELFLPNKKGITFIPFFNNNSFEYSSKAAKLTQGFMLIYLEKALLNSEEFRIKSKIETNDFKFILIEIEQIDIKIFEYYLFFKEILSDPTNDLESPLIYISEFGKIVIKKNQELKVTLESSLPLLTRINVVNGFTDFINHIKDLSLK